MNTSTTPPKAGLHPLIIAAAVAILLFCGVGIAAVMGWLPSSNGNANSALTTSDQLANTPAPLPSQAVNQAQPSQAGNAALPRDTAPRDEPRDEPRHAPVPERVAAVCGNCGVVESVREITTRAEGSGVGAAGGAVVGGLLGNQVGSGHGRQLATIAGAIGGAVAGNQIEGSVKANHSYDIRVRLDDGKVRTFHQSSPPGWQSGDHVRVVNGELRGNG